MKRPKCFYGVNTLFLILVFLMSGSLFSQDKLKPAPQFKARDLKGKIVTSEKLYSSSPCVVFFWHSCCGLNKDQLKLLQEFYTKHKSEGFEVVGIALDGVSKTASVKKAVKLYQMDWVSVVDANNEIKDKFGPVFLPSVYLIEKGGLIHSLYNGFEAGDDVKQKKELESLLNGNKE